MAWFGWWGLGGVRNRLDAAEAKQVRLAEAAVKVMKQDIAYYQAALAGAEPDASFTMPDGTVVAWSTIETDVAAAVLALEGLIADLS